MGTDLRRRSLSRGACSQLYRGCPEGGFTLIELLVVMVIIGIIVSFAVISGARGGPEEQLRKEAERLQVLTRLASEESVLLDRQIGLLFSEGGYEFLAYGDGGWSLLVDEILRPRQIPSGVRIELSTDGDSIRLDESAGNGNGRAGIGEPQVIFLSSGEMTPFNLDLRHESTEFLFSLRGSLFGGAVLSGPVRAR